MQYPNETQLKRLREKYPIGTKIQLISMDDIQAPPVGTIGEVTFVDDIGNIHVKWQNGSSLAVIPGVDKVTILSPLENS